LLSNNKNKHHIILTSALEKRSAFLIFVFILICIILSCSDKKNDNQKPIFSFADSVIVNAEAKKLLGENLKFVFTGNFDEDSLQEIAAGIELTENNNWGIKFFLLKFKDGQLQKTYESELLDGSFKDCLVKKIKFPNLNYDLIYYNSQDYFWGSGGGEVFAYVINFAEQKTFYAHLFSESRKPAELFLSKNINEPDLRKFFISNFKKDYPGLKLASEDVSLEF
jgi:hypothetical protein